MIKITKANTRGFLLPLAIFVMVILSGLGINAMRLNMVSNQGSNQDVLGKRAYFAAKAAAEESLYLINAPDTFPLAIQPCSPPTTFTIDGILVRVDCYTLISLSAGNIYTDGNEQVRAYEIRALATQGVINTPDYIERQYAIKYTRCINTVLELECS